VIEREEAVQAPSDSRSEETGVTSWQTMADGQRLLLRDWPRQGARGAVLFVHGLGEHSGRYDRVAAWFNQRGYAVRGYDQRGHGQSPGRRGALRHRDDLLADLAAVYQEYARATPHQPLLLGHSMGGLVAARAVLGKLSHDPQVAADYRADPLRHGWITPRLADFIFREGAACIADAAELAVPTLLLVAESDALVDPAGSRAFARAAASSSQLTTRFFASLYHELFNETEPGRGQVLMQLGDWLGRQLPR